MTKEEQLKMLIESTNNWNKWREENQLFDLELKEVDLNEKILKKANLSWIDLSGANLSWADLSEADLSWASLIRADLSGVNLSGANITESDLDGADLIDADLSWADLSRTNLMGADLRRADLSRADLRGADLRGADLKDANLSGADLYGANLSGSILSGADLGEAFLREANLSKADLTSANLKGANLKLTNLTKSDLSGADLNYVNLSRAILVNTKLENASLNKVNVYGISAWDLVGIENATQKDIIISKPGEPEITVDNLEVAQFIYLMLNNQKVREVIDTVTSKVVLLLSRVTEERKSIPDAIKEACRKRNMTPILFDLSPSENEEKRASSFLLAKMAKFVIADLSDLQNNAQELAQLFSNLPSVPVQPIILSSQEKDATLEQCKQFPWVLDTFAFDDEKHLIENVEEKVFQPLERHRLQL